MSKIAIVYWSGTGNTEAMANLIADGAKEAGKAADLFAAADFSAEKADEYDIIAFGCPSMGDEELEEEEFKPMFDSCVPHLKSKKIALFGSYGWGDGEWMRTWEASCNEAGLTLVHESIIVNEAPEGEDAASLVAMGKALAE